MALGVGTVTCGVSVVSQKAVTLARTGGAALPQGTMTAGSFRVQVPEVSKLLGPAACAIFVTHS